MLLLQEEAGRGELLVAAKSGEGDADGNDDLGYAESGERKYKVLKKIGEEAGVMVGRGENVFGSLM